MQVPPLQRLLTLGLSRGERGPRAPARPPLRAGSGRDRQGALGFMAGISGRQFLTLRPPLQVEELQVRPPKAAANAIRRVPTPGTSARDPLCPILITTEPCSRNCIRNNTGVEKPPRRVVYTEIPGIWWDGTAQAEPRPWECYQRRDAWQVLTSHILSAAATRNIFSHQRDYFYLTSKSSRKPARLTSISAAAIRKLTKLNKLPAQLAAAAAHLQENKYIDWLSMEARR